MLGVVDARARQAHASGDLVGPEPFKSLQGEAFPSGRLDFLAYASDAALEDRAAPLFLPDVLQGVARVGIVALPLLGAFVFIRGSASRSIGELKAQFSPGSGTTLVVLLHGYGGAESLSRVQKKVQEAFPDADLLFPIYQASTFSNNVCVNGSRRRRDKNWKSPSCNVRSFVVSSRSTSCASPADFTTRKIDNPLQVLWEVMYFPRLCRIP